MPAGEASFGGFPIDDEANLECICRGAGGQFHSEHARAGNGCGRGAMQFSFCNPIVGLPLVRVDRLRLLGATGRVRLAVLSDLPVIVRGEIGEWSSALEAAGIKPE